MLSKSNANVNTDPFSLGVEGAGFLETSYTCIYEDGRFVSISSNLSLRPFYLNIGHAGRLPLTPSAESRRGRVCGTGMLRVAGRGRGKTAIARRNFSKRGAGGW